MTKNNMSVIIQTHITIIHNDADLIQNSIIIVTTTHATMLYQSISSIYKDSKHAVQFCLFPRMLRAGKIRKGLLEAEHQELTSGIGIAMHGQEKSKLIMDSTMMNQNHHIITHMITIGFLECILPGGYSWGGRKMHSKEHDMCFIQVHQSTVKPHVGRFSSQLRPYNLPKDMAKAGQTIGSCTGSLRSFPVSWGRVCDPFAPAHSFLFSLVSQNWHEPSARAKQLAHSKEDQWLVVSTCFNLNYWYTTGTEK